MARFVSQFPVESNLSDSKYVEKYLRALASFISPDLSSQVGALDWRHGEKKGICWSTEGFVKNELILLSIEEGSKVLTLAVDSKSPFLKPISNELNLIDYLFLIPPLIGLAIGIHLISLPWGILICLAIVVLEFGGEVLIRKLGNKKHIEKEIDEAAWIQLIRDAQRHAVTGIDFPN